MTEINKKGSEGSGKYVVIEKLKKKFSGILASSENAGGTLASTSLLLEGIHFNLVYFPLAHLGYKAVVSSISGLYSKGARPENVSVNLGISTRHRIEDIETIFQGVEFACRKYTLRLSDIHVDSSLTGLTIAVTSSGGQMLPYNVNSKPAENDLICVTGSLGAAYMGLHILERERKVFEETGGSQPQLAGYEAVIGKQLKPDLPVSALEEIVGNISGITSINVLREGLSSELIGICLNNSTGCRIYFEKVPVSVETRKVADEFGIEPIISALNGGDDYQFIFTAPLSEKEKIDHVAGVTIIGHITGKEEGCNLVLHDGSLAELKAPGWEGEDSGE